MHTYHTFSAYMKKHFGHPLRSIPVDLEFGCPNRDEDGNGGCTFCPQNGAAAVQTTGANSLEEQIKKAVTFAKNRYNAKAFMLYIQAYTGTFATLRQQKETYTKLLSLYDFQALSVGTRPDCLSPSTLEYLSELNKSLSVHVDLGVQSLNDSTLEKINREHNAQCSLDAIDALHAHGIKVFAHIIIGLPGESMKDWKNTIQMLVEKRVDGIKIHNLHVIKNTQLADEFCKKPFALMDEYEYAQALIDLLRYIPYEIPILRITTDTLEDELIAPKWHMSKGEFSRFVVDEMRFRGVCQGDMSKSGFTVDIPNYKSVQCKDGGLTLWEPYYKDHYHPKSGPIKQAKELFIQHSFLEERLQKGDVKLMDVGFGMGSNTLESMNIESHNHLYIDALDRNLQVIGYTAQLLDNPVLHALFKNQKFKNQRSTLRLLVGDARYSVKHLQKNGYDVIFLDPFLYTNNTTLISEDFLRLLTACLKDDGIIVCSTFINIVRVAFGNLGYKSEIVHLDKSDIKGIVVTKGEQILDGEPYCDPYLIWRDKQIIVHRDKKLDLC